MEISSVVFLAIENLGLAGLTELFSYGCAIGFVRIFFAEPLEPYRDGKRSGYGEEAQLKHKQMPMLISMGICLLSAAVAVSFVGVISFARFFASHMIRRFVGNDYHYLLLRCCLALLLILPGTFRFS